MSLLVVKGSIVAALPMKGWYVCMYVKLFSNVFLRIGYVYIRLYVVVLQCLCVRVRVCICMCVYLYVCRSIPQ